MPACGKATILSSMAHDPRQQARNLIDRLRAQGHQAEADRLAHHLTAYTMERGLLLALLGACEILLTAIEAIDPVTQTMVEELRVEAEKRLRLRPERQPQR